MQNAVCHNNGKTKIGHSKEPKEIRKLGITQDPVEKICNDYWWKEDNKF